MQLAVLEARILKIASSATGQANMAPLGPVALSVNSHTDNAAVAWQAR